MLYLYTRGYDVKEVTMKKILLIILLIAMVFPVYGEDTIGLIADHGSVILLIDIETGEILYANNAAIEYYGYTKQQFSQLNIDDINILSSVEIEGEMELAKFQERNFFEFKHQLRDGSVVDVDVYAYPVEYNGQEALLSIVIDRTEDHIMHQELKDSLEKEVNIRNILLYGLLITFVIILSMTITLVSIRKRNSFLRKKDQLTKTYNQYSLKKAFNQLKKQKKYPMAFFVVNIKHMKFINDIYGRDHGDQMIKEQAKMLLGVKYRDIIVARVSGNQFVLILPDCAIASAKILNMDIKDNVIEVDGFKFKPSVGYTIVKDENMNFDQVYSLAENYMYQNKHELKEEGINDIENELFNRLYSKFPDNKRLIAFSTQVSEYIAKKLELSSSEIKHLIRAAKYQDIGLGLCKDPETHSEMSYLILNALWYPKEVTDVVRYHHEYYDGSGKFGVMGKSIPFNARILCLVNDLYEEWKLTENITFSVETILNKNTLCYDTQVLKVLQDEAFNQYLNTLNF